MSLPLMKASTFTTGLATDSGNIGIVYSHDTIFGYRSVVVLFSIILTLNLSFRELVGQVFAKSCFNEALINILAQASETVLRSSD